MRPSPLPRASLFGLTLAAATLGLVEAINVTVASPELDLGGRLLAALYAQAPLVLIGMTAAGAFGSLAAVWVRARATSLPGPPVSRSADASAGAVAVATLGALLFAAARVAGQAKEAHGPAILAIATPAAALLAFYGWAVSRAQLARLDARFGVKASRVIGAFAVAFILSLLATTFARNEGLLDRLGRWFTAFLLAYPLLAVGFTALLWRRPPGRTTARASALLALLAAFSATDLVFHMDARPPVKRAILERTLIVKTLITLIQPIFDSDGDGYAGLLGGGDCDDLDPEVHPGQHERPRNGVDDDCFGGDSPGALPALPAMVHARRQKLVERPNLVLVTIDALSAAHVGYLGYPRPTTPNLDRLASQGLRFTWAFSQAPQTRGSLPSMFIGRYYSEIHRSPELWPTLLPENVTLAERLQEAGYRTAGFPAHRFLLPGYGLDQGFDRWDVTVIERHGQRIPHVIVDHEVMERALTWLNDQKPNETPFFIWIHLFDPHHFYQDHQDVDFGSTDLDLYDEEIRHSDIQLGRLIDWIKDSPFAKNTYIMVNADHAEGFGLHGYRYHGQHLYNDQVRVPMVMAGEGLPSKQIDAPVALLDVAPTLLELAGQPLPETFRGRSLLTFLEDPPPPSPPVFIEMVEDENHSDRRAMVSWPYKLHYSVTFDVYHLFDLSKDPDEQHDLLDERPLEFERLRLALRQWMSETLEPILPHR